MPERDLEPGGRPLPPAHCAVKAGARFDGVVALRGSGRLDGCVRGEVIGGERLWIGTGAQVEARIAAPEIVIAGEFSGEARARDRIELLGSARVRATLETPRLLLAEGAFFEGHCSTRGERGAPREP
ncbi:MAG TPA: polymer-forming cytoskeletal protein [Myxococcota bacterium]|nr:polymer-forming cytoskeletal protein [Myxococcota bacterium]